MFSCRPSPAFVLKAHLQLPRSASIATGSSITDLIQGRRRQQDSFYWHRAFRSAATGHISLQCTHSTPLTEVKLTVPGHGPAPAASGALARPELPGWAPAARATPAARDGKVCSEEWEQQPAALRARLSAAVGCSPGSGATLHRATARPWGAQERTWAASSLRHDWVLRPAPTPVQPVSCLRLAPGCPAHLLVQEDVLLCSSLLFSRALSSRSLGTCRSEQAALQRWHGTRCRGSGAKTPAERGQPRGPGGKPRGDGSKPGGCRWKKTTRAPLLPSCPPLRHGPCQHPESAETHSGFQTAIGHFPLTRASGQSQAGGAARPWPTPGYILCRDGDPGLRV